MQSNRIEKLQGLDCLVNLEELYISHNGITRIEGLEHQVEQDYQPCVCVCVCVTETDRHARTRTYTHAHACSRTQNSSSSVRCEMFSRCSMRFAETSKTFSFVCNIGMVLKAKHHTQFISSCTQTQREKERKKERERERERDREREGEKENVLCV